MQGSLNLDFSSSPEENDSSSALFASGAASAPAAPAEKPSDKKADGAYSVSEIVNLAKRSVSGLGTFKVVGEISGFRGPHARSGHAYFSIKDEESAMDVIMWRGVLNACEAPIKDGLQVEVIGSFDVYAASGRLSFIIKKLTVAGEGLLRQQVAELARKLQVEGLMAEERKKLIPYFCEKICVITSLSGAVIDDVKKTLARRNPLVKILAIGASVQGAAAAPEIIEALRRAQSLSVDAILLVRGGGSFEDLMVFNDEGVARAIAASKLPVVTGIGHEPDISIADMVADRSMSTPTAAAESIAPAKEDLFQYISNEKAKADKAFVRFMAEISSSLETSLRLATSALEAKIFSMKEKVQSFAKAGVLTDPFYNLNTRKATLEQTSERLLVAGDTFLRKDRVALENLSARLVHLPSTLVRSSSEKIARLTQTLNALNPENVLQRGYAIVSAGGKAISQVDAVNVGQEITVLLQDGKLKADVVAKDEKKES